MDENVTADSLSTLSSIFYNFGPFFLALLFQFVVIAKARTWYKEACTRAEPPCAAEEIETYRYYFLGTVAASIVLFGLATFAWWHWNVKSHYEYEIDVADLQADQTVAIHGGGEYFSVNVPYYAGATILHTMKFLISADRPFQQGETFTLDFNVMPSAAAPVPSAQPLAQGAQTATVTAQYSGHPVGHYHLKTQNSGPALVLDDSQTAQVSAAPRLHLAELTPGGGVK